ncbi:MAG: cytochrome c biogenesis protein CcsA [Acidobacteria bacterium]|nr:cytochrome c biogenesis protein CcsA [Acidobacteriota bacterium]
MRSAFLWLALVLYALGMVLSLPSIIRRRPALSKGTLGALALGLVSHVAALAVAGAEIQRLPVTDVRSALSFFSFLATVAFFFVYLRYRITALGLFMLPLVFVLTLISALHPVRPFDDPAFRGGWLLVHIASIFLGYTAFLLTFVAAVMYLIQERELKSKKPRAFYYRLPSLEVCDELHFRSLMIGLPFLSVGILTGFIWASRTWEGPWELDPKIVASIITWLIYLLLFSTRLSGLWRGRRAAYVAIFGFAAMMVTFLGISFLSGPHGYFPEFGSLP